MDKILSFSTIFVECVSALLFFDAFLKRKLSGGKLVASWLGMFAAFYVVLVGHVPPVSYLKIGFSILVYGVFALLAYEGNLLKKFFLATLFYILNYGLDYVVILALMRIFKLSMEQVYSSVGRFIAITLVSKTVLFLTAFILRKLRQSRRNQNSISVAEWLTLMIFPVFTVVTLLILGMNTQSGETASPWVIIDTFGLALCNIVIVIFMERLNIEKARQRDSLILHQQVAAEMNNIQALSQAYQEQRQLTHDFNNHMLAIEQLAEEGDLNKLTKYVAGISQRVAAVSTVVKSNNAIVDAVLNQKYLAAKNKGVQVEFLVGDLAGLPFADEDLVAVLSNLMDNAIKASAQAPEGQRQIRVKFTNDSESGVLLSVKNTTAGPVRVIDNEVVSESPRTLNHGYGINNIKNVLAAYNCEYLFSYENGWFQFTLLL